MVYFQFLSFSSNFGFSITQFGLMKTQFRVFFLLGPRLFFLLIRLLRPRFGMNVSTQPDRCIFDELQASDITKLLRLIF